MAADYNRQFKYAVAATMFGIILMIIGSVSSAMRAMLLANGACFTIVGAIWAFIAYCRKNNAPNSPSDDAISTVSETVPPGRFWVTPPIHNPREGVIGTSSTVYPQPNRGTSNNRFEYDDRYNSGPRFDDAPSYDDVVSRPQRQSVNETNRSRHEDSLSTDIESRDSRHCSISSQLSTDSGLDEVLSDTTNDEQVTNEGGAHAIDNNIEDRPRSSSSESSEPSSELTSNQASQSDHHPTHDEPSRCAVDNSPRAISNIGYEHQENTNNTEVEPQHTENSTSAPSSATGFDNAGYEAHGEESGLPSYEHHISSTPGHQYVHQGDLPPPPSYEEALQYQT